MCVTALDGSGRVFSHTIAPANTAYATHLNYTYVGDATIWKG